MTKKLTVREACRKHMPLDGADAQGLEHALTITERERDEALGKLAAWEPIVRAHLRDHPASPTATDLSCPDCKLTRALADKHRPTEAK